MNAKLKIFFDTFTSERSQEFWTRMSLWIFFTVGVSSMPLIFDYFTAFKEAAGGNVPFSDVYKRGELCLISTALIGVAAGELSASNDRAKLLKIILMAFCLMIGSMAIHLYTLMRPGVDGRIIDAFSQYSKMVFIAALSTSTAAMAVTELKRR